MGLRDWRPPQQDRRPRAALQRVLRGALSSSVAACCRLIQWQYYGPDYDLNVRPSNMENANTAEYLEKIKNQVVENIRRTMHKPSVQMTDVPSDLPGMDDEADGLLDDLDDDEHPDDRYTRRRWDKYTEKDGELSESEDDEALERNGVRRNPRAPRKRNIMDYRNAHASPDDEEALLDELNRTADADADADANADAVAAGPNGSAPHDSPAASSSRRSSPALPATVTTTAEPTADNDVQMGEDEEADDIASAAAAATTPPSAPAQAAAEGPQAVTPPESPPAAPAPAAPAPDPAPSSPPTLVPTDGDQEMTDAGAEAEADLAEAQANGVAEREAEKSTAEQGTALAKQEEEEG